MFAEILGPTGEVRFSKPLGHPMIQQAEEADGYSVRIVEDGTQPLPLGFRSRESGNDDVHEKLRSAICVPTRRHLWIPADAIDFVPALASRIYGDGRALLGLTTINSRPAFYVIRIDSAWKVGYDGDAPDDATEIHEFIDEILLGLEDEFGSGRPGEEDDDEEDRDWPLWPALDDRDGCSWWREKWPEIPSQAFEHHPWTWEGNLLTAEI